MSKTKIYTFAFIDEDGFYCGWNDVQATGLREARKLAKKYETEAHWALYDSKIRKYVTVPNEVKGGEHCFRMKGTYVDKNSFEVVSIKKNIEMHKWASMMCR